MSSTDVKTATPAKKGPGCFASAMGDFRDFILRGTVIDLAIAVVIGKAVGDLVSSFVASFITPILAIIGGKSFEELYFSINGSQFTYGVFINSLITFISLICAVYFCMVVPLNTLYNKMYGPLKSLRTCPECCSDVPGLAKKCKFCCVSLTPTAKGKGTLTEMLSMSKGGRSSAAADGAVAMQTMGAV